MKNVHAYGKLTIITGLVNYLLYLLLYRANHCFVLFVICFHITNKSKSAMYGFLQRKHNSKSVIVINYKAILIVVIKHY